MKAVAEMKRGAMTAGGRGQPDIELHDRIRTRAYELYEQRGREDGHDVEDWLKVEKEIQRRSVAA